MGEGPEPDTRTSERLVHYMEPVCIINYNAPMRLHVLTMQWLRLTLSFMSHTGRPDRMPDGRPYFVAGYLSPIQKRVLRIMHFECEAALCKWGLKDTGEL